MRKMTNEEAKNYVGGFGCACDAYWCGWYVTGYTEHGAMSQAISHAGLGHVVHCYVSKKVFDKYAGDNPNLVWY